MTVWRKALLLVLWMGSLGAALLAGALAHKYRARIRAYFRAVQDSPVLQTSLYNLRIRKVAVQTESRDGGIAAVEDGVLFVNRRGASWFVDSALQLHPVSLRAPTNVAEFEADPYTSTTEFRERFGVKDILVQRLPGSLRLLVAHAWWNTGRRCYTLRVSALETRAAQLTGREAGDTSTGSWRMLFESTCRELLGGTESQPRHVTLGWGGRLAALSDTQIMLSVGEFSAEYAEQPAMTVNDSAGKTILIDVAGATGRTYSWGHRNAQGLAVAPDGRIWLTEHGARGGDELNLVRPGRNYGVPEVTYGTQYGMLVWPRSPAQGRHEGYEKPIFAWVPSIATSQLAVLSGRGFPYWAGDLLIGTLASQNLYRVRVEEDRVIFVEPMVMGHRLRDIDETASGSIVLLTDDGFLVYLDNLDGAASASLAPVDRGALLAGQCRSCHTMAPDSANRIGPNLWGVVGRRVASSSGYRYSDALRNVGGTWTREQLKRYLADPPAFAPGTSMAVATGYTDQQLADLVAYLETLR